MSIDLVTWKMVCCNTFDVILRENIRTSNIPIDAIYAEQLLDDKYDPPLLYASNFYYSMSVELGWPCWFNQYISEHTGYKIDETVWHNKTVEGAPAISFFGPYNQYGFRKSFNLGIRVVIVDEKKFTLSVLSQNMVYDQLQNTVETVQGTRCTNLIPELILPRINKE